MILEITNSVGDLGAQWDALVDAQAHPSPFLKSWWVDNAAAVEPTVLTCLDEGRLVGGAAFEMDRHGNGPLAVKRIRFVGTGVLAPDHLDLVADPEHRHDVTRLVARWLWDQKALIDLDGLSATSTLPGLLGLEVVSKTPCPYMELDPDTDPIANLPGRVRSTVKRSKKRLAKLGYEPRRVNREDIPAALDQLLELHEDRWEEQSGLSSGWDRFRNAAIAGSDAGDVVIHEIADDHGTVIASELELCAGTSAAFYQAGRTTDHDFRGSGSVLRADIIQWARNLGLTEFDFLRGDETYKADWATAERDIIRARGSAPGSKAWAASKAINGATDNIDAAAEVAQRFLGEERTRLVVRRLNRIFR